MSETRRFGWNLPKSGWFLHSVTSHVGSNIDLSLRLFHERGRFSVSVAARIADDGSDANSLAGTLWSIFSQQYDGFHLRDVIGWCDLAGVDAEWRVTEHSMAF